MNRKGVQHEYRFESPYSGTYHFELLIGPKNQLYILAKHKNYECIFTYYREWKIQSLEDINTAQADMIFDELVEMIVWKYIRLGRVKTHINGMIDWLKQNCENKFKRPDLARKSDEAFMTFRECCKNIEFNFSKFEYPTHSELIARKAIDLIRK